VIRARGVTVRFRDVLALPPTSFDLGPADRLCVVGPNGSGKTTLLRVLAGLLRPTAGSVEGTPAPGRVVLVHQRPHLFRGTPLDNLRLAARLAGDGAPGPDEILERLGLASLARRDVRRLSGGERRRVAVARALARRPEVLLLDEPLAELDADAVERVVAAVSELPGVVVTASPFGPSPLADRELRLA
jgi:tungstate transport system ATP-binding protein